MGWPLTVNEVRLLAHWFSGDQSHLVPVVIHGEGFLLFDSAGSGLNSGNLGLCLRMGIHGLGGSKISSFAVQFLV